MLVLRIVRPSLASALSKRVETIVALPLCSLHSVELPYKICRHGIRLDGSYRASMAECMELENQIDQSKSLLHIKRLAPVDLADQELTVSGKGRQ